MNAIPPAPALIVIASAVIVNLRFMMYSASVAPYIKQASTRLKMIMAYMLSDQSYAVAIAKFAGSPDMPYREWYLFGTTLTTWTTWQIGNAIGIFLGAQVPRDWSLDFMIPLSFMALMMPTLKDRASGAAALAAGTAAVAAFAMPFRLGMLTAVFIGIIVGMIIESPQRPQPEKVEIVDKIEKADIVQS
jgi:predicted branched-subunit amino acid permease